MDGTMMEAMGGTMGRGNGGGARREARHARALRGHATRRFRAMARPGDAEVARLVAEFHARGGTVTLCPPACAAPVRNGDGLVAAASVAASGDPSAPGPA